MVNPKIRRPEDDMTPEVRERIVVSRLAPRTEPSKPIRKFLASRFHLGILLAIHFLFSIYLRVRLVYHLLVSRIYSTLYYHHRTPELIQKDVSNLARLPGHLSVILEYDEADKLAGLDSLMDDLAEVASWTACVGIPQLTVYERTGILKNYVSASHKAITQRFLAYFGKSRPSLRINVPHSASFSNGDTVPSRNGGNDTEVNLEINFISEEDGRESLVDLTKTLCEMRQKGKISAEDVTLDFIDAEITETGIDEPDLLILFTPTVKLQGYPPWQIRLTEIFHVADNEGVGYQVFLRALHRYAKTEMRFGR